MSPSSVPSTNLGEGAQRRHEPLVERSGNGRRHASAAVDPGRQRAGRGTGCRMAGLRHVLGVLEPAADADTVELGEDDRVWCRHSGVGSSDDSATPPVVVAIRLRMAGRPNRVALRPWIRLPADVEEAALQFPDRLAHRSSCGRSREGHALGTSSSALSSPHWTRHLNVPLIWSSKSHRQSASCVDVRCRHVRRACSASWRAGADRGRRFRPIPRRV